MKQSLEHGQKRSSSKKLDMLYEFSAGTVGLLREALEAWSNWVPDPHTSRVLGCAPQDTVRWATAIFDAFLTTLSDIEDAPWSEQTPEFVPNALVIYAQEVIAHCNALGNDDPRIAEAIRIHERLLEISKRQRPRRSHSTVLDENLMFALCSEAALGAYVFMQEHATSSGELHHYDLLDMLECLDSAKELMDELYHNTPKAVIPAAALLRDLATRTSDAYLNCSQKAAHVLRKPILAMEMVVRHSS